MARLLYLGHAQHFIAARDCWFHLGTLVEGPNGRYVVSTVGDYYPPSKPVGAEKKPTEIGYQRLFETYVFRATAGNKPCGCPEITEFSEIDSLPANDAARAQANHAELVAKWFDKAGADVDVPRLVGS